MTIREAKTQLGTSIYVTSAGDTITTIVRSIYTYDYDKAYRVIQKLNPLASWFDLKPGTEIEYIHPNSLSQVNEIVSR